MTKRSALKPEIKSVWASAHEEGMRLELSCEIEGRTHYFAAFVADEKDESLFMELFVDNQRILIPVGVIETAISDAKKDVHSEAWYDSKNGLI